MKGISQDEHRGFNKYKLNYAYVNRAGMYEHWKCEKCDSLFMALKDSLALHPDGFSDSSFFIPNNFSSVISGGLPLRGLSFKPSSHIPKLNT